jgi:NADH:ubiquinone oxidoreductase subunit 5 (subunit L)/multisubunit Na+/H+ antiporter MnhA subunit
MIKSDYAMLLLAAGGVWTLATSPSGSLRLVSVGIYLVLLAIYLLVRFYYSRSHQRGD